MRQTFAYLGRTVASQTRTGYRSSCVTQITTKTAPPSAIDGTIFAMSLQLQDDLFSVLRRYHCEEQGRELELLDDHPTNYVFGCFEQ